MRPHQQIRQTTRLTKVNEEGQDAKIVRPAQLPVQVRSSHESVDY